MLSIFNLPALSQLPGEWCHTPICLSQKSVSSQMRIFLSVCGSMFGLPKANSRINLNQFQRKGYQHILSDHGLSSGGFNIISRSFPCIQSFCVQCQDTQSEAVRALLAIMQKVPLAVMVGFSCLPYSWKSVYRPQHLIDLGKSCCQFILLQIECRLPFPFFSINQHIGHFAICILHVRTRNRWKPLQPQIAITMDSEE